MPPLLRAAAKMVAFDALRCLMPAERRHCAAAVAAACCCSRYAFSLMPQMPDIVSMLMSFALPCCLPAMPLSPMLCHA